MSIRQRITGILFALTAVTGVCQAAEFEAGDQYVELVPAVTVPNPDKIEVVEMFWYGCPHCYQFESVINPWAEQLPEDVEFRRVPAMFGRLWDVHGQLFLTLDVMQVEHRVHSAIFAAIHQGGQRLATPEAMADFVEKQGIDRGEFLKTYGSFAVKSRMAQARRLVGEYGVTGVPTMVVNGKYRFDISSAGGPQKVLELADYLIDKERQASED